MSAAEQAQPQSEYSIDSLPHELLSRLSRSYPTAVPRGGPWAEEQFLIGLKRTIDHPDHWKDHGYCPTNQNRLCGYRRPAAHLVHANSYLEFNRLSTRHAENQ